jgi:LysR family transcriptional activator of nhaA
MRDPLSSPGTELNSAKALPVNWLNYHHLYYLWNVAREGTITAACKKLRLAQPTISAQLRSLEEALGEKLFERSGRNLTLTETGHLVYRYADEIFSLGHEMLDTLKGLPVGKPLRLRVGVADALPKRVVYHLLEPSLNLEEPVHLVCSEGKPNDLLARLAVHELDVVLSDSPVGPDVSVRAFSHLLGECSITILGTKFLARKYRDHFPDSLDGAPVLFPTPKTVLRRSLEQWFEGKGIRPVVRAEFDDSALQKVFAQAGLGLVPVPSVIAEEVQRSFALHYVASLPEIKKQFYAISLERKIKHPAIVAIVENAREDLFTEITAFSDHDHPEAISTPEQPSSTGS